MATLLTDEEIKILYPHTCDVCGEQATQTAFDYLTRDNIKTSMKENKSVGNAKYGCDEHPVYSEEFYIGYNFNPFTGEVHEDW